MTAAFPIASQTVIAGQPSLVTLKFANGDGTVTIAKFYAPPGASITLPSDIVRTADLLTYVSGAFYTSSQDLIGQGFHWSSSGNRPVGVFGDNIKSVTSIGLLTDQDLPNLLGATNGGVRMTSQQYTAPVAHLWRVSHPVSFNPGRTTYATASVNNSTPYNPTTNNANAPAPVCLVPYQVDNLGAAWQVFTFVNSNGTLNYVNGSGNSPATVNVTIFAVGAV